MGKKSHRKKIRRQIMRDPSSVDSIGCVAKKKDRNNDGTLALLLIKVIRWGAYIALFAPLVIHSGFFFPFVVPKTVFFWMFAEIIFAAWVLLAISNKKFRPKWNFLSVSFGVFMFVTIFTSFVGVNIERSFWSTFERMAGTINWIHLALFFSALAFTFKTVGEWRKLLSASFIAASIVAIIFILDQKFGVSIIPFETRSGATIGNSSFMAAYLLFNVFFGIWLVSVAKKSFVKILYVIVLAAIIFAVLNSTAYGALLSMLGGFFIIFLAWIFFTQRIKFARTIVTSILFASVLIGGVVVWGTFVQNDKILKKLPYFFSNSGTIGARRVIWDIAWQGVKERPILGWGAENFNVVFTKYFNPCLPIPECGGEAWFDRSHNIIFDNLINSGIIGLLSYLSIFVAALFILWRNFWRNLSPPTTDRNETIASSGNRNRGDWLLPSIVTAILASYFTQNLLVFDMPNTYIMFALTLAFVFGISFATKPDGAIMGAKRSDTTPGDQITKLSNPSPTAIVIVGLFLVYYLFSFGIQSFQAGNWGIRINRGGISPEERIILYKKSLSITPLGNRQIPEFITNNMSQAIPQEEIYPDLVMGIVELMEKTVKENPLDFRQRLLLGNFYAAARAYNPDYLQKAEETLLEAIEMAPRNQLGYISIGQVYLLRNKPSQSISSLEVAVDLETRYKQAYKILGDVYQAIGDTEKAQENFRLAE